MYRLDGALDHRAHVRVARAKAAVPGMGTRLQVKVPSGDAGAGSPAETPASTRMARGLSAELDEDQAMAVNSTLWGFLAGCVQGAGTTVSKRSEHLNVTDAWGRMVRQIDKGLPTQYETPRREVKAVFSKPIRTLEQFEEGIAAFKNAHSISSSADPWPRISK